MFKNIFNYNIKKTNISKNNIPAKPVFIKMITQYTLMFIH